MKNIVGKSHYYMHYMGGGVYSAFVQNDHGGDRVDLEVKGGFGGLPFAAFVACVKHAELNETK